MATGWPDVPSLARDASITSFSGSSSLRSLRPALRRRRSRTSHRGMTPTQTCPECSTELPADARRGICPACLLKAALDSPSEDETIHLVLPDGKTEPLPFNEIGDYELIEQIGHGGMGLIFKARQRSLDRLVALKLIRRGAL